MQHQFATVGVSNNSRFRVHRFEAVDGAATGGLGLEGVSLFKLFDEAVRCSTAPVGAWLAQSHTFVAGVVLVVVVSNGVWWLCVVCGGVGHARVWVRVLLGGGGRACSCVGRGPQGWGGGANANALKANSLSHLGVWRAVRASGAPAAIVLQDDATLAPGFTDGVSPRHPAKSHVFLWVSISLYVWRGVQNSFSMKQAWDFLKQA